MLDVFLLFGIGTITGILTSLPMGPTNLWIVHAVLPPAKPMREILAFVFGLIFFDCFYALLSFWGFSSWFERSSYRSLFEAIAGLGLVGIGAYGFYTAYHLREDLEILADEKRGLIPAFSSGMLLGANPSFIAYWIVVASLTTEYFPDLGTLGLYAIFLGIVSGDILWYTGFILFVKRYLRNVSRRFSKFSKLAVAGVFIFVGCSILGSSPL